MGAVRANRLSNGQPKAAAAAAEEEESEPDPQEVIRASWTPDRRTAEDLVAAMMEAWRMPILTLSRAGRAFEGLEGLLGGFFDLGVGPGILFKMNLSRACIMSELIQPLISLTTDTGLPGPASSSAEQTEPLRALWACWAASLTLGQGPLVEMAGVKACILHHQLSEFLQCSSQRVRDTSRTAPVFTLARAG